MIDLAGDSLRLKDRIVTTQVFLTAYRGCEGQVRADEITFCIYFRIDPVVDQSSVLSDLDGNVMGSGGYPDGGAINHEIGFPDSKVMAPGDYPFGIRQG